MLTRYEKFLEKFDKRLDRYFEEQCEYVKCKMGCSYCCEVGEYPFSRLEAEYLMSGYLKLSPELKKQIRDNIKRLKSENPKYYQCPFLINHLCSVYKYRGIVCRTHGLAWYDEDENRIKLPYCVNIGLNYSKVFDRETGEVFIQDPIRERFNINAILRSPEAERYELECGEIRPLLQWF